MARTLLDCAHMYGIVSLAAGLLLGAWCAALGAGLPHVWIASVLCLGVGLLLAVSTRSAPVRPAKRAAPLFACLAFVIGQSIVPADVPARAVPAGAARLTAEVVRVRHGTSPSARVRVIEGRTLDGGLAFATGAQLDLRGLDVAAGARARLLVRAHPSTRFCNPSPHPAWPRSRAADGRGRLVGPPVVLSPAPPWSRLGHFARGHLRRALQRSTGERGAAMARALVLGESGALSPSDRSRVRDAGLAHVLAVSGLHVTLVAGAFVLLLGAGLRRVPWVAQRYDPRRIAYLAGGPVALSYAWLVSDAPSAWRAAVTAALAFSALALGRRPHPVGLTALAALVLAIARPDDVSRPGFLLSIVATTALVSAPLAKRSWAGAALVVGGRTMLATAPFVLWMFGQVPLVGLLANLVAVPVAAGALLPVAVVHAALASVSPTLGAASGPLLEALTDAFLAACEVFATVPAGTDLPPPNLAQGVAVGVACLAVILPVRRRWRALVLAIALLAYGAAEMHLRHVERPEGGVRVTFLDVGQGDAALVDLPDGRLMVIDAGGSPNGGPDPGAEVLVPLLRARRRSRIDVLVISHPHPDHYGGAAALLEAFEVGELWDTGQAPVEDPEGEYSQTLARARARGVRIRGPDALCGPPRAFGALTVSVLWPCPGFDAGWGPNDNSLVLELAIGARRVLFTGDVEEHGEAALRSLELGSVDVLKVAHHGSRTSSDAALVETLRPEVAVVSAGRENPFGHPHAEVWERLVRGAGRAFRTDRDGAVTVWVDAAAVRSEAHGCE